MGPRLLFLTSKTGISFAYCVLRGRQMVSCGLNLTRAAGWLLVNRDMELKETEEEIMTTFTLGALVRANLRRG